MPDLARPFVGAWNRAHAVWTRARRASSSFDHAVRAWQHFDDSRGDRLAAYMSYLGVLSLFPIIGLAFAVGALLVANYRPVGNAFYDLIATALRSFLPGLDAGTPDLFDNLRNATGKRLGLQSGGIATAIAGAVVLLYTGSGWISAQREALRTVFGTDPRYSRFFLIAKAHDIGVLVLLGLLLAVSVAASVLTQSGPVLRAVGMGPDSGHSVQRLAAVAGVVVGVATGQLLFLAQHVTLAGVPGRRWRDYLSGATVAAVGFEVLKQGATLLIDRVTSNAVSGAFAAIIAVLIWINLTSRVTLLGAAWTYTGWHREAAVDPAAGTAAGPAASTAGPAGDPAGVPPADGSSTDVVVSHRRLPLPTVTSAVSAGLAVLATAAAVTGVVRRRRH